MSLQFDCFTPPPSSVILKVCKDTKSVHVAKLVRKVRLPEEEAQNWLKHLQTVTENYKPGANKGAKTSYPQAAKVGVADSQELYTCSACGRLYEEATEEENWIGCNRSNEWFYWIC